MSPIDRTLTALMNLAIARQADFGAAAQRVYLHDLKHVAQDVLVEACYQLRRSQRPEFGSTMPSVGDILDAASAIIRHRREQTDEIQRKQLPSGDKPVDPAKLANFKHDVAEFLRRRRMGS